jgi:hypothetical protein
MSESRSRPRRIAPTTPSELPVALNGQVAGFEKNGKVIFALEASSSLDMISEEKPEELKEICTLRKAV